MFKNNYNLEHQITPFWYSTMLVWQRISTFEFLLDYGNKIYFVKQKQLEYILQLWSKNIFELVQTRESFQIWEPYGQTLRIWKRNFGIIVCF